MEGAAWALGALFAGGVLACVDRARLPQREFEKGIWVFRVVRCRESQGRMMRTKTKMKMKMKSLGLKISRDATRSSRIVSMIQALLSMLHDISIGARDASRGAGNSCWRLCCVVDVG